VKKVEGILREQNRYTATFYNIGEHSPISGIRAGVDVFKQSGADIIVSVGGGSPIDASKAIIYFLHQQLGGDFLRQIAIPTVQHSALRSILYGLFVTFDRCPNFNFLCERIAWDIPTKWVKRQLCARSTSHPRVSFSMRNLLLPLLKGCGESHLSFVRSIMCSMHTGYLLEYAPLTMLSRICISHS
jgi:Iron-containing alcohol dehydrogenase